MLIVHVKKPTGRGERRLSDVIGEWGRWNDVTVMQENDGASLQRAKITVRKRVRHERRIVATKSGGLLVDPVDTTERVAGPKVPTDKVLAAIVEGMTFADLATAVGVSKPTAVKYVAGFDDGLVTVVKGGRGRPERLYRTAKVQNTAKQTGFGGDLAVPLAGSEDQVQTAKPPIYE